MKYEDSGVNIDKAQQAKKAIGRMVKATWGKNVLSDVGAFGGLFDLGGAPEDPVLVSSIDGVGTKLIVAKMAGRYDTVGQDLVNHCVNDILVQGADPLFFLDYVASGRLEPDVVTDVVGGVAKACKENGCALIGGETAEMPGVYGDDDLDLAGCIVGVVGRGAIIDGSTIAAGDIILSLESSGLHTNGYSLAREIIFGKCGLAVGDRVAALGRTVGDELLAVHRSYLAPVRRIRKTAPVKGLAHITGGGVTDNLPRILPPHCDAVIDVGSWPVPPVFSWLQSEGEVDDAEMYRVFNMGLGMIVVIAPDDIDRVMSLEEPGLSVVGKVERGGGRVRFVAND